MKNIKELEITKEMYNRALEITKLYEEIKKLDCRTEEFKKLSNKVIKLEDEFEEEISDEFVALEIVNEYKRRERNSERMLSQDVNIYRFTYKNGNTRDYKFFSCVKDGKQNKYYTLRDVYYCSNVLPGVINGDNIEKIECIERNNNIDFK